MTRAIAFASFLILIPALFWHCGTQVDGTTLPLYDYVAGHPLDVVAGCAVIWCYCFVIGHAAWLACRLYNKVMQHLA